MMNYFLIIMNFLFLVLSACKTSINEDLDASNQLPPLIIDFESCNPPSGGCTVYFPVTGVASSFTSLFTSNNDFKFGAPLDPNATITLNSITLTTPYLLYTNDDVINRREIPEEWFPRTLTCTFEQPDVGWYSLVPRLVKCENFFPIGSMQMIGTVTNSQFPPLNTGAQLTPNDFTNVLLIYNYFRVADIVLPCGNNSEFTTYQNLAACYQLYRGGGLSEKPFTILPKGSAGFGNGIGGYVPFANTLFNRCPPGFNCDPDKNWFLVSCPAIDNLNLESCSWLSPLITTDNPAAGIGEFDSNLVPMQNIALNPNSANFATDRLTKGRLLWSGKLTNNYNFFEANGNNPRTTSPNPSYNFYRFIDNFTKAIQINQGGTPDMEGPLILAPGFVSVSVQSIVSGNGNLAAYNAVTTTDNACEIAILNQSASIPSAISTYAWQIPSYPMLYTLTGGGLAGTQSCEPGGGAYNQNFQALCNIQPNEGTGFRAIDSLPGFLSTSPKSLISSSVSDNDRLWQLANTNPNIGNMSDSVLDFTDAYSVRCVSTVW